MNDTGLQPFISTCAKLTSAPFLSSITTTTTTNTTDSGKPTIDCIKLSPDARLPSRAHKSDAGADLYSAESIVVPPGSSALVDTGISMKIPVGYGGFVLNRSSQRVAGITSNGTGLIDSDYRGTIKVYLKNTGDKDYEIIKGETRIAQLVIMPIMLCEFKDVWNDTERGNGGFGSTNKV